MHYPRWKKMEKTHDRGEVEIAFRQRSEHRDRNSAREEANERHERHDENLANLPRADREANRDLIQLAVNHPADDEAAEGYHRKSGDVEPQRHDLVGRTPILRGPYRVHSNGVRNVPQIERNVAAGAGDARRFHPRGSELVRVDPNLSPERDEQRDDGEEQQRRDRAEDVEPPLRKVEVHRRLWRLTKHVRAHAFTDKRRDSCWCTASEPASERGRERRERERREREK